MLSSVEKKQKTYPYNPKIYFGLKIIDERLIKTINQKSTDIRAK